MPSSGPFSLLFSPPATVPAITIILVLIDSPVPRELRQRVLLLLLLFLFLLLKWIALVIVPQWNPPARRRPVSPALLQADCALSALPPSRLPGLPATLAVLRYPRVVLVLVSVSRWLYDLRRL